MDIKNMINNFLSNFTFSIRESVITVIMFLLIITLIIIVKITTSRIKNREDKINFSLPKLTNKTTDGMKEKKIKIKKNKKVDVSQLVNPTDNYDVSENIDDLFETKVKKSIVHLPKVEVKEVEIKKDDLDITLEEIANL